MTHLRPAQNRGCELPAEIRSLFRRERKSLGISTNEAARRIGMHPTAFGQMENGTGNGRHKYETLQLWGAMLGYEVGLVVTKREGF